jgi:hypothetical protein
MKVIANFHCLCKVLQCAWTKPTAAASSLVGPQAQHFPPFFSKPVVLLRKCHTPAHHGFRTPTTSVDGKVDNGNSIKTQTSALYCSHSKPYFRIQGNLGALCKVFERSPTALDRLSPCTYLIHEYGI